jgi:predicted dithiol-disulfide oxidoreductase (DUF899 family)
LISISQIPDEEFKNIKRRKKWNLQWL